MIDSKKDNSERKLALRIPRENLVFHNEFSPDCLARRYASAPADRPPLIISCRIATDGCVRQCRY